MSDLIAGDIDAYFAQHDGRSLLRLITCGSADDGKTTLINRLLDESKLLFDAPLAAVQTDSHRSGMRGGEIEFALRFDGLPAEGDQCKPLDLPYRFISTDRRKFIVADTPGHEQCTRNMLAEASTADLAIILVDARKGVVTQTRRQSYLASLIGIRKVVLAVNKMDTVGYDEVVFSHIDERYRAFAAQIGLTEVMSIPLSGLVGDNIAASSNRTPWYHGPTLMELLESVDIDEAALQRQPLRLPVQRVNPPNRDVRGFCGMIASGRIAPGDRIRVQPSGRESRVARLLGAAGDLAQAVAGQSVTVSLTDEIDISCGDLISAADAPTEVADQFECTLVWMANEPMLPGRPYLVRIGTRAVGASVTTPKYKVNINTLEHLAARQLELDDIGVVNVAFDQPVAFDAYARNRATGGFIVIDRFSNATVGVGMLHFALRRASNIHFQHLEINKSARSTIKGQKPVVLWLTGLSGSGKSTIANLVEKQLHAMGRHSYLLDGDNVRHGLNKDLGFTEADRVENVRRVAEVSKLMVDAGLIVITAFISPFRSERRLARALVENGEFIEVHIDTPLEVAESRDVKGLYKKARRGELKNFTGIDSPYEPPEHPELRLATAELSAERSASLIIDSLRTRGIIG